MSGTPVSSFQSNKECAAVVALYDTQKRRLDIYFQRCIPLRIADIPPLGRRRYPRPTQQFSLCLSMGSGL